MKTSSVGLSSLFALSLRNGKASPSPSDPGVLNIDSCSMVFSIVLLGDPPESEVVVFGESTLFSGFKNSNSCSSKPKSGVYNHNNVQVRMTGIHKLDGMNRVEQASRRTYISQDMIEAEVRVGNHSSYER